MDKDIRVQVEGWIEAHKEDLVQDLKDFCAIPSVKGDPGPGMPYGEGPREALRFARSLCEKYGFACREYGDAVVAADYDPGLPRHLDILAHADVVPAGEGWTVTEPFSVLEKDGKLYGRGTSDDKGPALAALYALRAIRASGIRLQKGVRFLIGSDEECGSSDIALYYAQEPEAEMTFSPDAEFPLINIEKGQFQGIVRKEYPHSAEGSGGLAPESGDSGGDYRGDCDQKDSGGAALGEAGLPRLLSLRAGVAVNAVPQKAVLRVEGLPKGQAEEAMREVEKACGVQCQWTGEGEITVIGVSAHASTPETGRNAGLAAVLLATKLPLRPAALMADLSKLLALFPYGVTDGSGLGIRMSDAESHALTLTLDLFQITSTSLCCQFDARTPLMANEENCYGIARRRIEEAGFQFEPARVVPPHRVAADSAFVRALLAAYEEVTGLPGECLAIGGGTYVHDLKNGVAYGAILPGVDTRMHGADEFIDTDNLILAAKVYAAAILRIDAL